VACSLATACADHDGLLHGDEAVALRRGITAALERHDPATPGVDPSEVLRALRTALAELLGSVSTADSTAHAAAMAQIQAEAFAAAKVRCTCLSRAPTDPPCVPHELTRGHDPACACQLCHVAEAARHVARGRPVCVCGHPESEHEGEERVDEDARDKPPGWILCNVSRLSCRHRPPCVRRPGPKHCTRRDPSSRGLRRCECCIWRPRLFVGPGGEHPAPPYDRAPDWEDVPIGPCQIHDDCRQHPEVGLACARQWLEIQEPREEKRTGPYDTADGFRVAT